MRTQSLLFCDDYAGGDYGVVFGTDLYEKLRKLDCKELVELKNKLIQGGVPVRSLSETEVTFDRSEAPNVFANEYMPTTTFEGDRVQFSESALDLKKKVIKIITAW